MPFKFEKLDVWKLSLEFANDVHFLTRKFPKDELFSLASQFKRAADSVPLNISEGSTGLSDAEQRKFIGYAIRSLVECITCLHLSKMRGYVSDEQFTRFYASAVELFAKMNKFKNSLKN